MVKFNKVKQRYLFLSPTVQAGWEDESNIKDFDLIKGLGKGKFKNYYNFKKFKLKGLLEKFIKQFIKKVS